MYYHFLDDDLAGSPQAPSGPEIKRISPTSVELSWTPPRSDGGSEVTGYLIEKKDKSGRWTPVTDSVDGTSFTVKGLREGGERGIPSQCPQQSRSWQT